MPWVVKLGSVDEVDAMMIIHLRPYHLTALSPSRHYISYGEDQALGTIFDPEKSFLCGHKLRCAQYRASFRCDRILAAVSFGTALDKPVTPHSTSPGSSRGPDSAERPGQPGRSHGSSRGGCDEARIVYSRYLLTSDTVHWSIQLASGQSCVRGVHFGNVLLERISLINPPKFGKLDLVGPGFRYTANPGFHGEDTFSVEVLGTVNKITGSSTIHVGRLSYWYSRHVSCPNTDTYSNSKSFADTYSFLVQARP